ncbi:MAG: hypothetical protein AAF928_08965 [Myxococcota bacterium]
MQTKLHEITKAAGTAVLLTATMGLVACDGELPTGLALPTETFEGEGIVGGQDADGDDIPDGAEDGDGNGDYAGGDGNTFDHEDDLSTEGSKDPFEVLKQRQEEGPPEIRTRLHSCQKPQNSAIGRILSQFGVDMAATADPPPAGQLFAEGRDALGAANYPSRTGERRTWSNSSATKFQDIFVMAAPEIIAAMPTLARCQVNGQGVEMFDGSDQCNEPAVSCLIGRPATDEHLAICNHIVATSPDVEVGKAVAVATMMAGAYTCQ